MLREATPNEPTPRQYRPTYTKLSSSKSTSNFGSPFSRPAAQTATDGRRRRITSVFPSADHLHSAPTVATSGLTASVSSYDISHPTPKTHRLSNLPVARTPTRIPTPVPRNHIFSPVRSVSSPAAPPKFKENVQPTTHRLLGPIMPGPAPQMALTKSRTMNVLSSLTSTFSRSTNSLTTSRSSSNNLFSQSNNATTSSIPVPAYTSATTNIRQVNAAMPTAYWLGRYQALLDRFRSDFLDPESLASPKRRAYWTSSNTSATMAQDGNLSQRTVTNSSDDENNGNENTPCSRAEERLSKRVFTHLDALCITPEARKSLKTFQLAFARRFVSEALLPLGGSLVDERGERVLIGGSFIAKAGRLFSTGTRKSGGASSGSGGTGSLGGVMRPRMRSGVFGGGGTAFVSGSGSVF